MIMLTTLVVAIPTYADFKDGDIVTISESAGGGVYYNYFGDQKYYVSAMNATMEGSDSTYFAWCASYGVAFPQAGRRYILCNTDNAGTVNVDGFDWPLFYAVPSQGIYWYYDTGLNDYIDFSWALSCIKAAEQQAGTTNLPFDWRMAVELAIRSKLQGMFGNFELDLNVEVNPNSNLFGSSIAPYLKNAECDTVAEFMARAKAIADYASNHLVMWEPYVDEIEAVEERRNFYKGDDFILFEGHLNKSNCELVGKDTYPDVEVELNGGMLTVSIPKSKIPIGQLIEWNVDLQLDAGDNYNMFYGKPENGGTDVQNIVVYSVNKKDLEKSFEGSYITTEEKATVTVQKTDTNGTALSGMGFTLYSLDNNVLSFSQTLTTDSNGIVESQELNLGDYFLVEDENAGYAPFEPDTWSITGASAAEYTTIDGKNGWRISLAPGDTLATVSAVNAQLKGTAQVIKTDTSGNPLQGIPFRLYGVNDEETAFTSVLNGTTNANGIIDFGAVTAGKYLLVEMYSPTYRPRNPENWIVSGASGAKYTTIGGNSGWLLTIGAGNDCVVYAVNGKLPTLSLNKIDRDGNPMKDMAFSIYGVTGNTLSFMETFATDENGDINVGTLHIGYYFIVEEQNGKWQAFRPYEWQVRGASSAEYTTLSGLNGWLLYLDAGDTARIEAINDYPVSLTVKKQGSAGLPLAGATFTLEVSYNNGKTFTVVESKTTLSNGVVTFKNLDRYAYYRVTETKAPQGCALLGDAVFKGRITTEDITITVSDSLIVMLPSTGGNGTWIATLTTALSVICAGWLIVSARKRTAFSHK